MRGGGVGGTRRLICGRRVAVARVAPVAGAVVATLDAGRGVVTGRGGRHGAARPTVLLLAVTAPGAAGGLGGRGHGCRRGWSGRSGSGRVCRHRRLRRRAARGGARRNGRGHAGTLAVVAARRAAGIAPAGLDVLTGAGRGHRTVRGVLALEVRGQGRLSPAHDQDRRAEGDEQPENDAVGKWATPEFQDVVVVVHRTPPHEFFDPIGDGAEVDSGYYISCCASTVNPVAMGIAPSATM